jgi:hypothetical protein
MNSASLCSLAGRYENPIPYRCLAPIDCLKIPALYCSSLREYQSVRFSWHNMTVYNYCVLCSV